MSIGWLKCLVEKGMFSDERVVIFTALNGQQLSFFVPESATTKNSVKVKVFKEGERILAVIPDDDQSIVPVDRNLVAA